jgi:hypothetical protein
MWPQFVVREAREVCVTVAGGALWGLAGELLVSVVVPCRVPSKNDAGLKRFADMVTCLPRTKILMFCRCGPL